MSTPVARGMLVMQFNNPNDNYDMPLAITAADVADGRVMRLHIAKFSVGPREREPLWVMRGKENPWLFSCYEAQHMDGEEKAKRVRANIAAEEEAWVAAVVIHVMAERAKGLYPTKPDVRGSKVVASGGRKVPNAGKYRLISIALRQKQLVEVELPSHMKRGQKQTYLDIGPPSHVDGEMA